MFSTIRHWGAGAGMLPRADGEAMRLTAECALAALLALQAARLFWVLAVPAGPFGAPALPTGAAPAADLTVLERINAFLPATVGSADGAGASGEASTGGGFRLFGVRAGGATASAIIAGPDGVQGSWGVGDAIQPGVVLSSVAADHVILDRGGARVRLDFAEGAAATAPTAAPPVPAPAAQIITPDGVGGVGPAAAASSTSPALDPARFMAEAALSPRTRGGRIDGYVVQARGAGASLRALGLRSGDVLLAVNNQTLSDPQALAALRSQLATQPTAEIRYERDGQVRTATARIAAR